MKRAISVSFFLYAAALLTSLAGSEIFGWCTLLLSVLFGLYESFRMRSSERLSRPFYWLGPDVALWALLAIVLLSYFLNSAADAHFVNIGGQIRWVVLLYGLAWGVRWSGLRERYFAALAVISGVVALHGIQMVFTGWDFIRGRPVPYLANPGEVGGLYRACGFFTMPTNFAHSGNMTLCFLVAAVLLRLGAGTYRRWLYQVCAALMFIAVVLSFTRGAWISLFAGLMGLAALVNRRLVLVFATLLLTVAALSVGLSSQVRERVATMVNPNFASNSERLELWNENIAIIKLHPWLGIGLNENERLADQYNAMIGNPGGKKGNAHNTYLQFLSGSGILGLGAYLAVIVTFMMMTWRLWRVLPSDETWHRTLILGAWGAQIALHVGGLTDCNFKNWQVNHHTMAIWAVVAYLYFLYREKINTRFGRIFPA